MSEDVAGDRITDGDEQHRVDCAVAPRGDDYEVRLTLEQPPRSFQLDVVLTPVAGGTHRGMGSAQFYDPMAGSVASSTCVVEISANQEIGAGRAWGNFDCTQSTKEASPGWSCNFLGSFLVENCGE